MAPGNHPQYAVSFSGGKDSMLALDRALRSGLSVARLLTLYDEASERVRFHGVPVGVMHAQAEALGLPRQGDNARPTQVSTGWL